MKMKRFLASFLSVSMALSSVGVIAFAEGEETVTPAKAQGDLVWSEDFEGYENGADFSTNPSHDISLSNMSKETVSATINETDGNNKYMKLVADSTTTNNQTGIFVPAGEAKDTDGVFTVDVDLKIPYNNTGVPESADKPNSLKYTEYDIGLTSQTDASALGSGARAYFTQQGNKTRDNLLWWSTGTDGNPKLNSVWAINGDRVPVSEGIVNNPEINKTVRPYSFTAWNTYRFIVRPYSVTADDGVVTKYWYADVYVNGNYVYKVGVRSGANKELNGFYIKLNTRTGLYQEVSIDNIKMYYGATPVSTPDSNGNSQLAKGVFNAETVTFNHLTPGAISEHKTVNDTKGIYVGETLQANSHPIIYGTDTSDYKTLTYEARTMIARRHNAWTTTFSAVAGNGGKAKDDIYLLTGGQGGRLRFDSALNDIMRTNTYLHEGDSIAISADIRFKSNTETFTFNPVISVNNNGIRINPYWYSAAHYQNPDAYSTYKTNFAQPIPLNKWVNIKIVLTRGTSESYNKMSIYCDNIPMVVNEEIDSWYANSSYTNNELNTDATPINGDSFKEGITQIYFDNLTEYDNIKVDRYLQTEYIAPAVPEVISKTHGIIYTGTKTAADIIAEYNIADDAAVKSYTVRDGAGDDIEATATAAGNYIAVETVDGDELYIKMLADEEPIFAINSYEDYEKLGITPAGVLNVSGVDGAYGKAVSDTGVKLSFDTQNKNHFFNIDCATDAKNLIFEISLLPNETTSLHVGYRIDTKDALNKEYTTAIRFENGDMKYYNNVVGKYNPNEWHKIKIYFDRDAKQILASFDGGATKKILTNMTYYSIDWIRVSLSDSENGSSAVIDDIKLYRGVDPVYTAPSMTINDELSAKYFDKTISLPAYAVGTTDDVPEELFTTSFTAKYIDANGAEVADTTTVVDKVVVENDGIYAYYDVVIRDGITLVDNETEGKITAIVDGVSEEDIYSNVKLLRAVYNADKALVSTAIYDVPFEVDENGDIVNWSVETVADEYTPAEGETVKYFAWGMADNAMMPVCDSLDVQ